MTRAALLDSNIPLVGQGDRKVPPPEAMTAMALSFLADEAPVNAVFLGACVLLSQAGIKWDQLGPGYKDSTAVAQRRIQACVRVAGAVHRAVSMQMAQQEQPTESAEPGLTGPVQPVEGEAG